ncbi:unnamed protein product [Dicrocoelium dendriticum]|nr:unnamed protein product [Dicrocoelium dendriticum]
MTTTVKNRSDMSGGIRACVEYPSNTMFDRRDLGIRMQRSAVVHLLCNQDLIPLQSGSFSQTPVANLLAPRPTASPTTLTPIPSAAPPSPPPPLPSAAYSPLHRPFSPPANSTTYHQQKILNLVQFINSTQHSPPDAPSHNPDALQHTSFTCPLLPASTPTSTRPTRIPL